MAVHVILPFMKRRKPVTICVELFELGEIIRGYVRVLGKVLENVRLELQEEAQRMT